MKKLLGILFAALILFVGSPQTEAAHHFLSDDGYGKYYLDDDSIKFTSKNDEVLVHIICAFPRETVTVPVLFGPVEGDYWYRLLDGSDSKRHHVRNSDWTGQAALLLHSYGFF